MTRILGIDPGSRCTGYGVLEQAGGHCHVVTWGTVATSGAEMAPRLGQIFSALEEVVRTCEPAEVAVEKVFMARNADSALKLGQARGAAIAAVMRSELPVFEYGARQVKQAVVGQGGAAKEQVGAMVHHLLSLRDTPPEDAADALAVALCHAHTRVGLARLAGARSLRRGRARRAR